NKSALWEFVATVDRTRDLKIFSLTLSQPSYHGCLRIRENLFNFSAVLHAAGSNDNLIYLLKSDKTIFMRILQRILPRRNWGSKPQFKARRAFDSLSHDGSFPQVLTFVKGGQCIVSSPGNGSGIIINED